MKQKHWDTLFHSFSARSRAQRERAAETRELARWYDEQTELVMSLVHEVAVERAVRFEQQAGLQVEVRWPSHPPVNVAPHGPFMSFMMLSVVEREVHLYSHRVGATAPSLHYVVTSGQELDRHRHGLLGRPGCQIERREGGGFLLRSAGDSERRVLSVDDLAYRAFELLLA